MSDPAAHPALAHPALAHPALAHPALTPSATSGRVAVRYRLDDGRATDVVGELIDAGIGESAEVMVLPADGPPMSIRADRVVAVRQVPARAVRPTSSADDLHRLMTLSWPGLLSRRLGGWVLRAGLGGSKRANSTLVCGDPGLPVDAAMAQITSFAAEHGIGACVQVPTDLAGRAVTPVGAQVEQWADDHDWARESPTVVLVTDLRTHAVGDDAQTWGELVIEGAPSREWSAIDIPTQAKLTEMVAAPASYLRLLESAAGSDERVLAVARAARTADWVGVAAVAVPSELRGRGHGRAIMQATTHWALADGARFGYLQVEADNEVARGLYRSLGWREHSAYHYRSAP